MSAQRILVTGGSGFIGSALVKALLGRGETVRVFDDNSRGTVRRLREVERDIEFVRGDIRDAAAVDTAMRGIDEVHHLAFVNGTATFYNQPDLVLDVGVKGIVNVIDACRRHGVGRLVLASSSEVYQSPPRVPTDERAPLVVPDPLNPRFSYGAGKIISEMMAINHGRKHFERVLIFRPNNVYGPDMGFDHVIPQFAVRMKRAMDAHASGAVVFPIQGSGEETRSFCHVAEGRAYDCARRASTSASTTSVRWKRSASPIWRAAWPGSPARDRARSFDRARGQRVAPMPRHFEALRVGIDLAFRSTKDCRELMVWTEHGPGSIGL